MHIFGVMEVKRMDAANIITKLKNREPSILGRENYREYAVLIPLIENENETHILFEIRSANLRSQPGDICFPGGKIDKEDRGPRHAAIRETSEELGILRSEERRVGRECRDGRVDVQGK